MRLSSQEPHEIEHDIGATVGHDRVDDGRDRATAVRRLVVEDLGLRGDRADHVDVEVDLDLAVTRCRHAAVDRHLLDGRAGYAGDPLERGDVGGVEGVERHDRDRLALAVEAERTQPAELVDLVDDGRGHATGRASGDRGGHRGALGRSCVEPIDRGHEPVKRRRDRWRLRRGVVDATVRVCNIPQGDPECGLDRACRRDQ